MGESRAFDRLGAILEVDVVVTVVMNDCRYLDLVFVSSNWTRSPNVQPRPKMTGAKRPAGSRALGLSFCGVVYYTKSCCGIIIN